MCGGGEMHLFLSYAKSHIYELHAALAATITLLVMQRIKRPIKAQIWNYVSNQAKAAGREIKNCKRYNLPVLLLAFLVAFIIFSLLALISPLIRFSFPTAVLSGIFTLAEYALLDQILYGWKGWTR